MPKLNILIAPKTLIYFNYLLSNKKSSLQQKIFFYHYTFIGKSHLFVGREVDDQLLGQNPRIPSFF